MEIHRPLDHLDRTGFSMKLRHAGCPHARLPLSVSQESARGKIKGGAGVFCHLQRQRLLAARLHLPVHGGDAMAERSAGSLGELQGDALGLVARWPSHQVRVIVVVGDVVKLLDLTELNVRNLHGGHPGRVPGQAAGDGQQPVDFPLEFVVLVGRSDSISLLGHRGCHGWPALSSSTCSHPSSDSVPLPTSLQTLGKPEGLRLVQSNLATSVLMQGNHHHDQSDSDDQPD
mmetsp:Transcript_41048/g.129051  ORF Transcript_41048/g.129051 Transcript_41048/m.129051 type:complete len:230 (-) Transcript_41048:49-738(-)